MDRHQASFKSRLRGGSRARNLVILRRNSSGGIMADGFHSFHRRIFPSRTRAEYETFHGRKHAGKRNSRVIDAQVALQTSVGNVNWICVVDFSSSPPLRPPLFFQLVPFVFLAREKVVNVKFPDEISRWKTISINGTIFVLFVMFIRRRTRKLFRSGGIVVVETSDGMIDKISFSNLRLGIK